MEKYVKKYYPVPNYPMKCRVYPTTSQKDELDKNMRGVSSFWNITTTEFGELNPMIVIKKPDGRNPGKEVSWPDFKAVTKKEYIDYVRSKSYFVRRLPGNAISSNKYGIGSNMKKSAGRSTTGKILNELNKPVPIELWGTEFTDKDGKKHKRGIQYIKKSDLQRSYTYQIMLSAITISDTNENVFYIDINSREVRIPKVKVRGYNKSIRFDENNTIGFLEYVKQNPKKKVSLTVKRDKTGDYWVILHFDMVWNVKKELVSKGKEVGMDVGEIDLVALSNGYKSANLFDNNYRADRDRYSLDKLNRKLSKAWGWRNPTFREARKKDYGLQPSAHYKRLDRKHKEIHRSQKFRQEDFHHKLSAQLTGKYETIYAETLKVSEMYDRKKKKKENKQTKKVSQPKSRQFCNGKLPF